jgi:hypothetical protein
MNLVKRLQLKAVKGRNVPQCWGVRFRLALGTFSLAPSSLSPSIRPKNGVPGKFSRFGIGRVKEQTDNPTFQELRSSRPIGLPSALWTMGVA